jgi:hypothetical protein
MDVGEDASDFSWDTDCQLDFGHSSSGGYLRHVPGGAFREPLPPREPERGRARYRA